MRKSLFLTLLTVLLSFSIAADDTTLLKVQASIKPNQLSRGQEGEVVLKFIPERHVTISPHPSFTIELNSSEELIFPKNFFTASDLEIGILEKDGDEYLDFSESVSIPFTVNLDAVRGRHTLEGKVKYFARAKAGGWCLKISSRFTASFYTRSTVFKKEKSPGD